MTTVHNFRASHHCSKSVSAVQLYSPCPRYYFKFLTKFLFHIIYIYKSFLQQLLGCYRRHSNPTLLFLCLHSLHLRRFLFRGRLILSTYFSQNSCTLWFACMPFAVRVNHSKLFKPSAQLNKGYRTRSVKETFKLRYFQQIYLISQSHNSRSTYFF